MKTAHSGNKKRRFIGSKAIIPDCLEWILYSYDRGVSQRPWKRCDRTALKKCSHPIDQPTMTRMIILDCVGILLVLVSAMVVGSFVSKIVGTRVFNALQTSAPLWAEAMAIVSSLLAALAAGVGVGWLVRTAFWQGGFDIISGLIYQLERA
jgi:hypothetical protein